jgi:LacI family transcriptional regulator
MRRAATPTLKDVALAAGASITAASVVLNGATSSARVSGDTRERILDAATRLRYRRNAVALGLARQRMNTIGVAATIGGQETNLYFLALLDGILSAAVKHGQGITVFSTDAHGASRVQEYCDGRIDGLILIAPYITDLLIDEHEACPPILTLHADRRVTEWSQIDVDNESGSYTATRHLLDIGHTEIAHLAGPQTATGAIERLRGFRRAMGEAGVEINESWLLECDYNIQSGERRTEELLRLRREGARPTGIVCASDAIAYGCASVLAAHDVRVPRDISVVGFDDTMLAQMTRPPLTTVRQPFDRMGTLAVQLLLEQIELSAGDPGPSQEADGASADRASRPSLVFTPEIVIRESTAPPHQIS